MDATGLWTAIQSQSSIDCMHECQIGALFTALTLCIYLTVVFLLGYGGVLRHHRTVVLVFRKTIRAAPMMNVGVIDAEGALQKVAPTSRHCFPFFGLYT